MVYMFFYSVVFIELLSKCSIYVLPFAMFLITGDSYSTASSPSLTHIKAFLYVLLSQQGPIPQAYSTVLISFSLPVMGQLCNKLLFLGKTL